MAVPTRRNTANDATWCRAWTAATYSDLANIPAWKGPERGDVAYVTDLAKWFVWRDDGTWQPQSGNLGALFTQTQSVTVANTVTETTLIGTGVGSLVIPANTLQVGMTVKGWALGFHSAVANPNIQVRVYFGSTVVLDTGIVTSGNSTNAIWEARGFVTVRSIGVSGTVAAQGFYMEGQGGPNLFGMVNTSTVTIDTTASQTINMTVQWGTASASNTITCTNHIIEGVAF